MISLGQQQDSTRYVGIAASAASLGVSHAVAAGWLAAGAAGPIGLAIAGVAAGLTFLFQRKGPQQRIAATRIVDEVEPFLAQNRDGYLAGERTAEQWTIALANFDYAWGEVVKGCSNPQLGDPGRRCIDERQSGGRWDWFQLYRDPIEQARPVRPLSVVETLLPAGGSDLLGWALPVALIVVGVALSD